MRNMRVIEQQLKILNEQISMTKSIIENAPTELEETKVSDYFYLKFQKAFGEEQYKALNELIKEAENFYIPEESHSDSTMKFIKDKNL